MTPLAKYIWLIEQLQKKDIGGRARTRDATARSSFVPMLGVPQLAPNLASPLMMLQIYDLKMSYNDENC